MAHSLKSAAFLIESRLAEAARGSSDALYELGVAYSTGTHGLDVDLIEAHKWFNLAALNGNQLGQICRAEIAEEMTAREIAEAQRQARAWLAETGMRRAA
jgi:TPR repeat protein